MSNRSVSFTKFAIRCVPAKFRSETYRRWSIHSNGTHVCVLQDFVCVSARFMFILTLKSKKSKQMQDLDPVKRDRCRKAWAAIEHHVLIPLRETGAISNRSLGTYKIIILFFSLKQSCSREKNKSDAKLLERKNLQGIEVNSPTCSWSAKLMLRTNQSVHGLGLCYCKCSFRLKWDTIMFVFTYRLCSFDLLLIYQSINQFDQ